MPTFLKIQNTTFYLLTFFCLYIGSGAFGGCDLSRLIAEPANKSAIRKLASQGTKCFDDLKSAYLKQTDKNIKIAMLQVIAQIDPPKLANIFLNELATKPDSTNEEKFFAENIALLASPNDESLQNAYIKSSLSNDDGRKAFDFRTFGDRGVLVELALAERLSALTEEEFDLVYYPLLSTLGSEASSVVLPQADKIFSKMMLSPVEQWRKPWMQILTILEQNKSDSWRSAFVTKITSDPRLKVVDPANPYLLELLSNALVTYEDQLPDNLLAPIASAFLDAGTTSPAGNLDAFGVTRDRLLSFYLMLKKIQHNKVEGLNRQMEALVTERIFEIASSDVAEFRVGMSGVISNFNSPAIPIRKLLESKELKHRTAGLELARGISVSIWNGSGEDASTVRHLVSNEMATSNLKSAQEMYGLQLHETYYYMNSNPELETLKPIRVGLHAKDPQVRMTALNMLNQRKTAPSAKVAMLSEVMTSDDDKDMRAMAFNLAKDHLVNSETEKEWKESRALIEAFFSLLRGKENIDLQSDVQTAIDFYFIGADLNAKLVLNDFVGDSDPLVAEVARTKFDEIVSDYLYRSVAFLPRGQYIKKSSAKNPVRLLDAMQEASKLIAEYMTAEFQDPELNSDQAKSQRLINVAEANIAVIEKLVPFTKSSDPVVREQATKTIEEIRRVVGN